MIQISKKRFSIKILGPYYDEVGLYFVLITTADKEKCRIYLSDFIKKKGKELVPVYVDRIYFEAGGSKYSRCSDGGLKLDLSPHATSSYRIRPAENKGINNNDSLIFEIEDESGKAMGFKKCRVNWNLFNNRSNLCPIRA